jgi:hypothetical protein
VDSKLKPKISSLDPTSKIKDIVFVVLKLQRNRCPFLPAMKLTGLTGI